jgi:hypothetical protein
MHELHGLHVNMDGMHHQLRIGATDRSFTPRMQTEALTAFYDLQSQYDAAIAAHTQQHPKTPFSFYPYPAGAPPGYVPPRR